MFKTILKISATILMTFLLVAPDAFTVTRGTAKKQKEKREKNNNKSEWIMPEIKLLFYPRLTVGKLTGDAAKVADPTDKGMHAKSYYGGGIGLQYWYKPYLIFGAGFDLLQKDLGYLDIDDIRDPVRVKLLTAEVLYRYPARAKASFIFHFKGGDGSVSYTGDHIGNYFFKRFGLGIMSFGGSNTPCFTFEIYYQTANTKGSDISIPGYLSSYEVPVTLTTIGLEVGLGIPLLKN